MKETESMLDALRKTHAELVALAAHLQFNKDHSWDRNLVSLYLSIVELSGCIPVLLDGKHGIGIPPIFRTLLDTHIEFINLSADKRYGYYMEISYSHQWLILLQEAQSGNNPYLVGLSSVSELNSRVREHQETVKELKSKGYRVLTVRERFERAGQLDQHKSIYNSLCNNDHPNIRALIDRHLEIGDEDFSVVMYKDNSEVNYQEYIVHACAILLDSSYCIHNVFFSGKVDAVKEMMDEFAQVMKDRLTRQ